MRRAATVPVGTRAVLLMAVLLMTAATVRAQYVETETIGQGDCGYNGDNVTWTLTHITTDYGSYQTEEYVLAIEGSGRTADFSYQGTPWNAFIDDITSVTVSEGVTYIGDYAFYGCENLKTVTLNRYDADDNVNPITDIGQDDVFYECDALEYITVPTNGLNAYKTADSWRDASMETKFAITGTCKTYYDQDVTWILKMNGTIGDPTDEIQAYALIINAQEQNTTIQFDSGNYIWDSYKDSINSITIIGAEIIGEYAFQGYDYITTICLADDPDNYYLRLNAINGGAFSYCPMLMSVRLDVNTLPTLEEYVFYNCDSLKQIIVPANALENSQNLTGWTNELKSLFCFGGTYQFSYDDVEFSWILKPNGTMKVDPQSEQVVTTYALTIETSEDKRNISFDSNYPYPWNIYLDSITSITIRGAERIISNAFNNYMNLRNVLIADFPNDNNFQLREIERYAFTYCEKLTTVQLKVSSLPTLCEDAFYECDTLTHIIVPVEVLGNQNVNGWTDDLKAKLCAGGFCGNSEPDGDNMIWTLTDVDGNGTYETLTIEGTGAMADFESGKAPWYGSVRESITRVIIGYGVRSIGEYAFQNCTNLTTIVICGNEMQDSEYGVTRLNDTNAFLGCNSLTHILVPRFVTPDYYDSDNWNDNDLKKLIYYGGFCGKNGVYGDNLVWFLSDEDDRTLNIEGVGAMNDYDGSGIDIPWHSNLLKDIVIGDGVTAIGTNAFYEVNDNTDVMTIRIKAETPPYLPNGTFDKLKALLVIAVPSTSVDAYKGQNGWNTYTDLIQGGMFLPPTGLAVNETTENSVTLTWKKPATYSTVTGYAYQYKKSSAFAWSAEETATDTTVTLSGLSYGTSYQFRVKTLYGSETSPVYTTTSFDTYNAFKKPVHLTAVSIGDKNATVTWEAPDTDDNITGYAYRFRKAGEDEWSTSTTAGAGTTSATISGLSGNTGYVFGVRALYEGNNFSNDETLSLTTAMSLPYGYGFENGFGRWSRADVDWNNSNIFNSSAYAHEGNCFFRFSGYTNTQYLISPPFGGTEAVTMSFHYRMTLYDQTFQVGYSTTTGSPDAFIWGEEIKVTDTDWKYFEKNFPAGAKYFAVKDLSDKGFLFLDGFSFTEANPYDKPIDLGVDQLAEHSATISWTAPNTSVSGYTYQYKPSTGNTWSNEASITATTVNITGLSVNTSYDFRVTAMYGGNSSNYATLGFQTEAEAVNLPYNEDFENGMGGWRIVDGRAATGIVWNNGSHSGNNIFSFTLGDYPQYLISPRLDCSTPFKMSFYCTNYVEGNTSYTAGFRVGYSTTTKADDAFIWSDEIRSSHKWQQFTAEYPANTKYIAIKKTGGYLLYLDDFSFTGILEIADDNSNGSIISACDNQTIYVRLKDRTLYRNGDWNTLCLPFNVADGDDTDNISFTGTPLEGATVKEILTTSSLTGNTLTLNFEDAASIMAGRPYIVKWNNGLNFTVNTADDWNTFAASVNGGNSYAGKTVLLNADISVSTMVGTEEHPFSGTFEGAGHTLNLSINGSDDGAAPFRYINGATIRNVKTTGSVNGGDYSAGLAGIAKGGRNIIRDCYVDVAVNTSGSYVGGILGNGTTSTTTISNCLFSGSVMASYMGIFYGWGDAGGTHTVENCVAYGTYGIYGAIDLLLGNGTCTVTNCWKNKEVGYQGENTVIVTIGSGYSPLVYNYLGSQWTYINNQFELNPTVNLLDTNIDNPLFAGVTIDADAETTMNFTGGRFVGTFSPFSSTDGLLTDAHNPSNSACRAALSIDTPSIEGLTFGGWYTDAGFTTPVTTIPFTENGTATLYAKFTDGTATVGFAKEGYATYYNSQCDAVLPAGMKARIITAKADGQTLTYETVADGDLTDAATDVVPAGTAVMLQIAPDNAPQNIDVTLTAPTPATISQTNLLHGSDTETITTGGDQYYKLSYNRDGEDKVIGWYWGADNAGAFISGAHKAWLALPSSGSGAPLRSIALPGFHDGITDVPLIPYQVGQEDVWYDTLGRRLLEKPTTEGLYIHNGKTIMIK